MSDTEETQLYRKRMLTLQLAVLALVALIGFESVVLPEVSDAFRPTLIGLYLFVSIASIAGSSYVWWFK